MLPVPLPHADHFQSARPLQAARDDFERAFFPHASLAGCYAGLLQWQDHFLYALARSGGTSYVLSLYDGRYAYLPMPPRPLTRESLETAFGYMARVNGPDARGVSRIEGLTKEESDRVASWGYPIRRVSQEFVYDRARVAGLHGDPYRAKRADVNHLLKHYGASFRAFHPGDAESCMKVYGRWSAERALRLKGETGERMLRHAEAAHARVMKDGADWGLSGWVVEVEGEIMAYAFGTRLSPDTHGVLLEVADLTVKGLSAYIFSRVCSTLEGCVFVNGGDAEELPGLAEAKEHWHPVCKTEIYAVDGRS